MKNKLILILIILSVFMLASCANSLGSITPNNVSSSETKVSSSQISSQAQVSSHASSTLTSSKEEISSQAVSSEPEAVIPIEDFEKIAIYDSSMTTLTKEGENFLNFLKNYALTYSYNTSSTDINYGNEKYNIPFDYGVYAADCASFVSRAYHFSGVSMTKNWYYYGLTRIGDDTAYGKVGYNWKSSSGITKDNDNIEFSDVTVTLMGGANDPYSGFNYSKNLPALKENLKAGDLILVDFVPYIYGGVGGNIDHTMICVGNNENGEPLITGSNPDITLTITELLNMHDKDFSGNVISKGLVIYRPISYVKNNVGIYKNVSPLQGYGANGQMSYIWNTSPMEYNEYGYKFTGNCTYSPVTISSWSSKEIDVLYSLDYYSENPCHYEEYTNKGELENNKMINIILRGYNNSNETLQEINERLTNQFTINFNLQSNYEFYCATQIAIWLSQNIADFDVINTSVADSNAFKYLKERNIDISACNRVWVLAKTLYGISIVDVENIDSYTITTISDSNHKTQKLGGIALS